MKAVSLLVNVLGGAGLFVAAGAGWLAVQGRLDSKTLSALPGLSHLAPPEPDHGDGEEPKDGEHASAGETTPTGGGSSPTEPATKVGEKPPAPAVAMPVPVLPEPFSASEVNEMLRASGRARTDYEARAAGLDERERELARAERDLDERRREIESLMERFAEIQGALADDRTKFERDVVRLKEAEVGNVKKLAGLYEGMPDAAAATALGQVDVATAAKVLAAMQKRKAGKVLGAMPAALAAEVSDKMTRIVDESRAGTAAPETPPSEKPATEPPKSPAAPPSEKKE